jgi:hypothetical protein
MLYSERTDISLHGQKWASTQGQHAEGFPGNQHCPKLLPLQAKTTAIQTWCSIASTAILTPSHYLDSSSGSYISIQRFWRAVFVNNATTLVLAHMVVISVQFFPSSINNESLFNFSRYCTGCQVLLKAPFHND